MKLTQLIGGVARRVRPGLSTAAMVAAIAAVKEQLSRARASVEQLKQEREQLVGQVRRLRAQTTDLGVHRHRIPSTQVLEQMLPARAAAFRARPANGAALAREQALMLASAAYRESIETVASAAVARAEEVEVAGLHWSVPLDERARARTPEQWVRLRAILQSREVATGGVMLDIGAHVGRIAIPRVLLGDADAVYAAEPDALNYACLVRNVALNGVRGCVLPDRVAIGAHTGRGRLLRSRWSGGHRLAPAHLPGDTSEADDVAVMTLDEWVAALGIGHAAISFVSLDTQGTELDVLAGAGRLLACPHIAWRMRLDPEQLVAVGRSLDDAMDVLASSFTHFIDLWKHATGPRVRPVGELKTALEYLWTDEAETELLLYSARAGTGEPAARP